MTYQGIGHQRDHKLLHNHLIVHASDARLVCWSACGRLWERLTTQQINKQVTSVETYYCLWRAVGNDLMFEVEVIDPKDDQRDMTKKD